MTRLGPVTATDPGAHMARQQRAALVSQIDRRQPLPREPREDEE